MDGVVGDDADFLRLRNQYEAMTIQVMKEKGYTPVLGLGPFWSTAYDEKTETYTFISSVYGVYVGRKKACQLEGITVDGKETRLSTTVSK